MTDREKALAVLNRWTASYGETGETVHDERLVDAVAAALAEERERCGWRPIAELPDPAPEHVLARTAYGRVMYWPTEILLGNLERIAKGRQPDHLQFPAIEFMEVPG